MTTNTNEVANLVRERFKTVKPTPWQAYTFSRLSVQTPLASHERSYELIMDLDPHPTRRELRNALMRGRVPFWRTKARDLYRASKIVDAVWAEASAKSSDKEARLILAKNLDGVGLAKSSFMLMLMGREDVACIDTHMVKILKLRTRPSSQKQYAYAERKLRAKIGQGIPLGLAQWANWVTHMGLVGTGHDIYFNSLSKA